jgi:hypothetical protein
MHSQLNRTFPPFELEVQTNAPFAQLWTLSGLVFGASNIVGVAQGEV